MTFNYINCNAEVLPSKWRGLRGGTVITTNFPYGLYLTLTLPIWEGNYINCNAMLGDWLAVASIFVILNSIQDLSILVILALIDSGSSPE